MCFAPQRRALFRHLNLQKWSEPLVLCATTACTFSTSQLPKVVRTWCVLYILTSKCASRDNGVHFFDISTAKSGPDLVCFVHFDFKCASRHNGVHFFDISTSKTAPSTRVLYILTWKCASRHNGVQFFISPLASWLRTRRFSEPTFRPSRATNHRKTQCFATFLPFRASPSSFFLLFLFYSSLF